eukprot:1821907-Rhodomonas_salina.1
MPVALTNTFRGRVFHFEIRFDPDSAPSTAAGQRGAGGKRAQFGGQRTGEAGGREQAGRGCGGQGARGGGQGGGQRERGACGGPGLHVQAPGSRGRGGVSQPRTARVLARRWILNGREVWDAHGREERLHFCSEPGAGLLGRSL